MRLVLGRGDRGAASGRRRRRRCASVPRSRRRPATRPARALFLTSVPPSPVAASVSLTDKTATVSFDPSRATFESLRDAVEDCGFDVPVATRGGATPATPATATSALLIVEGMTCRRCVEWVSRALRSVDGVVDVEVDLETKRARVTGALAAPRDLVRRVNDAGYSAQLLLRADASDGSGRVGLSAVDVVVRGGLDDDDDDDRESQTTALLGRGASSRDAQEVTLRISGMSCAACVAKVEEAARRAPGVANAVVNLLAETATVTFEPLATRDASAVAAAISSYGYQCEVIDASGLAFRVGGMVCASCPPRIEMSIGRMPGVSRVDANELLGKVVVRYDAELVGARTIMAAIERLGYEVDLWDDHCGGSRGSGAASAASGHAATARRYKREFFISVVFAGPLLVFMMGLDHIHAVHEAMMTDVLDGAASGNGGMLPVMALMAWILATPVQFGLGRQFYARAWKALKQKSANMVGIPSLHRALYSDLCPFRLFIQLASRYDLTNYSGVCVSDCFFVRVTLTNGPPRRARHERGVFVQRLRRVRGDIRPRADEQLVAVLRDERGVDIVRAPGEVVGGEGQGEDVGGDSRARRAAADDGDADRRRSRRRRRRWDRDRDRYRDLGPPRVAAR